MFEALQLFDEEEKVGATSAVAILFVKRTSVRPVIRQELKDSGFDTVITADSANLCVTELNRFPKAMLVVDWEYGPDDATRVLRAAQGSFNIDTRPIYLLAVQADDDVVAIGMEFNVMCIQTGDVSRAKIKEHVQSIFAEEAAFDSLRSSLLRVADARGRGDWKLASSMLLELYAQNPDDERIGVELANNLIQEDKWQEARQLATELAQKGSTNLRALHIQARCLMHEGKHTEASEVLLRAKVVSPHNVDRLIDLGNCFMLQDKVQEARENFDEALNLDKTNRRAVIGRSQCSLLDGEVNEALAVLRQISGPREFASIFNNSAILSIRQGRFDEGMKLYATAIAAVGRRNTTLARLVFNMGIGYYRWKKSDEAAKCFAKAAALDSSFHKAKHNVAAMGPPAATKAGKDASTAAPLDFIIDEEDEDFMEEVIDGRS